MTESIPALIEMIRRRIGQDYDGEAHFAEHEALQIADALASLTAPDFLAECAKNPAPATRAEIAQVQPATAGMPGMESLTALILREAVPTCEHHEIEGYPLASLPDWRAQQTAISILALFAPLAQEYEKLKAERDEALRSRQTLYAALESRESSTQDISEFAFVANQRRCNAEARWAEVALENSDLSAALQTAEARATEAEARVAQAVEEEREACAVASERFMAAGQFIEGQFVAGPNTPHAIARAIRARTAAAAIRGGEK